MRILLVGVSLGLIALAASPAEARYRHHHYSHSAYSDGTYREARYESCNCYFGYMGNAAGACTPITSCSSSGGRCRASCPAQTGEVKGP
jgi:hypothetical protein